MTAKPYKPTQCSEHFIPYLPKDFVPKWFIDLGPGAGCEALCMRQAFPAVKVLGLEPSPLGYKAAAELWKPLFSGLDAKLLHAAAWSGDGNKVLMKADDVNHGTFFADHAGGNFTGPSVRTRSLDSLDWQHGPFENAVLWMDVEGSEQEVLKGASELLARRAIKAVNLEVRPETKAETDKLLTDAGFKFVREYFKCETYWDEVWLLKEQA